MDNEQQVVNLTRDMKGHYLLLSVNAAGHQNVVRLVAYGSDPADESATLIFVIPPGRWAPQEIKLGMSFPLFHDMIQHTTNLAVTNWPQEKVQIDPDSELGKVIALFNAQNAQAHVHPVPGYEQ